MEYRRTENGKFSPCKNVGKHPVFARYCYPHNGGYLVAEVQFRPVSVAPGVSAYRTGFSYTFLWFQNEKPTDALLSYSVLVMSEGLLI